MTVAETAVAFVVGVPIAAVLYLGVLGLLEWAVKRDEPKVPRDHGHSRDPR